MTHVFIAPHPDDVALSCGGLIASLRELGQTVTILTVFSGSGDGSPLSGYQREALGFGSKTLWPNTEAFNRASISADVPAGDPSMAPPWAATSDRLDATQEDADASAKRFWQRSSWYRRASIRNKPLAGQPQLLQRQQVDFVVGELLRDFRCGVGAERETEEGGLLSAVQ